LDKDFGQPSPVFLENGKWVTPDSDGVITLRRSDTLMVACPGDKKEIVLSNVTQDFNQMV
jgi:hypothetical protein